MSSQLSAHAITAHTAMTRISVSRCSTLPAQRGSARAEKCSTSFSTDIAILPSSIKGEPAQPVSPSELARPFHASPLPQEAALAAQERPPQRRRPAWAITVVVSAELVLCLHRLRVLAAGQGGTEKRAVGGCQPAWIAGRPALVGRLGACRSHPQAPGFGPPSRPSAWPAPAEPEPAAALVSQSQTRECHGWWSRPQGPARSRLAAGPCPPSARVPPQDVAVEPLPPPAPVGCAARLGRHRQS